MPVGVLDAVRGALAEVCRAGVQSEAGRCKAATERLSSSLAEQEAQIEELAEENTRLQKLVEELVRQRGTPFRAEQRLAAAAVDKMASEGELGTERGKRSEGLDAAIARIETLVGTAANSSDAHETNQLTISVPAKPE